MKTTNNTYGKIHGAIKPAVIAWLLIFSNAGKAQTLADTIRAEMVAINKVYDSAFFLTFDVNILYNSDTLWAGTDSADFTNSEVTGTYTFCFNKALYKLDNIEYMQNDSFAIALYNDDKFILVGRPPDTATGTFLGNRAMFDSMMVHILDYEYYLTDYDSIKQIIFKAFDADAAYQMMTVEYDPATYHLTKIKYRLKEVVTDQAGQEEMQREADLVFLFLNYRVERLDESVFSEDKYLFFDGPGDIKPAAAYKGYTIYKHF